MRVPDASGAGKATVSLSFDAWKEVKVAATEQSVSITLPKPSSVKLEPVSSRLVRELIHPNKSNNLISVRFSPDGKRVLAGDLPGGVIALWEMDTGKRLLALDTDTHPEGNEYYCPSPDWSVLYVMEPGKRKLQQVEVGGKQLQQWVFSGSVSSWSLTTGIRQSTFQHQPARWVRGLRLSTEGNLLVSFGLLPGTDMKGFVNIWNLKTGKRFDLGVDVEGYGHLTADGTVWAVTAAGKEDYSTALMLFDTVTGKLRNAFPVKEKKARVEIAAFAPDGTQMLVSNQIYDHNKKPVTWKTRLDVVNSSSGQIINSIEGEPNDHLRGTYSPNGRTIAASTMLGRDCKLILLGNSSDRNPRTILLGASKKGERSFASVPVFSRDSKLIAVVTINFPEGDFRKLDPNDVPQPHIHLIDVATGELRDTLIAPQGFGGDVCFSPDGRLLASCGRGRVLLWDVTK